MLLGRASTSAINSTKVMDSGIIAESDFNELFPEGYEETTLLPKPKEYWAMNKGTCINNVYIYYCEVTGFGCN